MNITTKIVHRCRNKDQIDVNNEHKQRKTVTNLTIKKNDKPKVVG